MNPATDADDLKLPQTLRWEEGRFYLIDQTRLPGELVEERQDTVEQVWQSIKQLKVRGAPAIGIAGAYGLVVAMKGKTGMSLDAFMAELKKQAEYLDSSRPTAVNLHWALRRMVKHAERQSCSFPAEILKALVEEAVRIHDEDRRLCRGMGESGKVLIREGMGILTHCNAGSLAASYLGTATAPMYLAHRAGVKFRVFADETRPLLQGARLTSWELMQAGIDVTLICDNMAASMMSQGEIELVITGTDRVAANGDVANKIGTLGVAILARHYGIPFYVACPYSTIDHETSTGAEIPIEERDPSEVTCWGKHRTAPEAIKVRSPAFDVTPHDLVTGLITEKGILRPPYREAINEQYRAA